MFHGDPHGSGSAAHGGQVTPKGDFAMQMTVVYAFVVVVIAPAIGILQGHKWAKANGLVLRSKSAQDQQDQQNQTA
jgi:hypothetical protein